VIKADLMLKERVHFEKKMFGMF